MEHGPGRPAGDVLPGQPDLASLGCEQAADDPQDRRLAGAVWAYEAGDLADGHVKVETAQDVALAIAGDDATQLQPCVPRSPAGRVAPLRLADGHVHGSVS